MIYLKLDNVPLFEAYEDEIEQEANGKYQLSFKFPRASDKWHLLTNETLLLADDLHGEQEFRIFEVVKRNGYLRIYANQVADDLNYKSITKLSVDRVSGQTVMIALAGSIIQEHNFSFYSDISDRHKFNQSDVTVMVALSKGKHSIIGQWGGELVRDKYQVKLLKKAGIDSEVLFMYKKNLDNFDQSESTKGLITRLHLKKVVESEETKTELKVTVDSPLISRYELIYEANIEVQDEDITSIEQLRRYGVDYFRKNLPDIPENSLSISVADSSTYSVRLFDTAIVHHELYDIDMRMQITSYTYSPVAKRLKSVGFGKTKTSLMQQTKQAVQEIEDKVDIKIFEQERQLQKEIDNANRHFEAEFEKGKQSIADGIEVAKAKAQQTKSELESKINADIKPLANEAKQSADRANQSIARQAEEMERLRTTLADNKREVLAEANQAATNAFNRAERLLNQSQSTLSGEIAAVSQTLSETKRNVIDQASAQRELSSRVTTVEETANGTKRTVTELQKTVNATTGNLDTVSRRTRTVEDNLSGLTTRFENIRVGGANLVRGSREMKLASGGWSSGAFRKSGTGTVETITVSDSPVVSLDKAIRLTKMASTGEIGVVQDNFKIGKGDYTLSYWVRGTRGQRIRLQPWWKSGYSSVSPTITLESDGWQKISFTGTSTREETVSVAYIYLLDVGSIDVMASKLERGNVATDWSDYNEDYRSELATYKQTADQNFANLTRTTQDVSGKVTEYKSVFDQTAERFRTSINALEAFKNDEGARESRYLSLSREETARQLREERIAISENYIAKSKYEADAEGLTRRFEKLNQALNDKVSSSTFTQKFDEILGQVQTLDGEVMKTSSFTINENGLVLQSGRTFDGRTIASLLTVNDDNIKAITDKMIITPNQQNLVKETYRTQVVVNARDTQVSDWYTFDVQGGDEFYFEADVTKLDANSNYDLKAMVTTVYKDGSYDATRVVFAPKNNAHNRKITCRATVVIPNRNKTVQRFRVGLQEETSSNFTRYRVENLKVYKKTSASLIVDGSITGRHIAAGSIEAGHLKAGSITADIIDADTIKAKHLDVDEAFINKLMTEELLARKITALESFTQSVQAVDISATRVTSGILASRNGAMTINLDTAEVDFLQEATIRFHSANNALVRKKGTHTAFVHFNDVSSSSDGGVGSLYASIGVTSSGDGINSASSGRFCGARFFRGARGNAHGATIDQAEIYGDDVLIKDDFSLSRGFRFRPTTIDKMIGMNYLVGAVRALSRCWLHWNNIGWDPTNNDMRRAVINEYNNYMKSL